MVGAEFYCTEFGLVVGPGMTGEIDTPHASPGAVAGESQDTVLPEICPQDQERLSSNNLSMTVKAYVICFTISLLEALRM